MKGFKPHQQEVISELDELIREQKNQILQHRNVVELLEKQLQEYESNKKTLERKYD